MSQMTRHNGVLADAALFAFCTLCFFHVPVHFIDDAFIAYRYAANLVHGFGLVFTVGQRVEGISDLGWTLLMAVPELLHIRPELFAIGVGSVSAAAAMVLARRIAVAHLGVSPLTAIIVTGLAAFNCDYWIMAGNGIESGLFALVLAGSFSLLLGMRFLWAGVLFGFATTLRPESVALVPISVFCVGVSSWRRRNFQESVRHVLQLRGLVAVWAAIVFSVLIWRHAYYGAWIQNTLVAKAHTLRSSDLAAGAYYVIKFAGRSTPWLVVSFCALFLDLPVPIMTALAWFAFQIAVVLPNAGDWMPGYRLLSVYLPLIALTSAFALDRFFRKTTLRIRSFAVLAAITCAVQIHDRRWTLHGGILNRHELVEMFGPDENSFMQIAAALRPALRPGDVLAPEVLGIFSYTLLDVPIHDWLGLADAHVAHYGTVYFPMFGKAEPAYSVETITPAAFVLVRGDHTIEIFQRETAGAFGKLYHCWLVTNRPERIMLAIRLDREQAILDAIERTNLTVQPILPRVQPFDPK
jgi:hypothetical protein